ncbi:MAG: hypothetical protein ABID38_03085 [Candidatus Diapherotrites archaeon]
MKKAIIIGSILIFLAISASAAPTISSAPETVSHGDPVLISGTDFGIKDPAPPLIYDNMETGSFNPAWGNTHNLQITANDNRHGFSSYNALNDYSVVVCNEADCYAIGSYGFFAAPASMADTKFFVQYWFNLDDTWEWQTGVDMPPMSNIKFFRMWPETGGPYPNFAAVYHTFAGQNRTAFGSEGIDPRQGIIFDDPPPLSIEKEVWHSQQFEFAESDIDVGNGEFRYWYDGDLKADTANLITRTTELPQLKFPYIAGGWFNSWGPTPNPVYMNIDEVYVDNTWARIEIGNSPSFNSSTHREIQIPSSWNDGIIEFTVNQGAFTEGQDAYLFVIDEFGEANETGYPISFGEAPACSDGEDRPCDTGEFGICSAGLETCSAEVWGVCVRTNDPVAEICDNGEDDDCDNLTNCSDTEDCELNPVCIVPTCADGTEYGACSSPQPLFCSDGELIDDCSECECPNETDACEPDGSCTACTPEPEICDNEIDDDCDTLIDCSDTNDCELDVACEAPEICLVDFAACEIYVEGGTATCTQTWLEYEYDSDTPLDNIVTNVPANYPLNILVENLTQETSNEFIQISSSEGVLEFSS